LYRLMKIAPAAACWWLLAAAAAPAEILPEVSVHLRAARYVPAETDMNWQGWIGAGAGLFEVGGAVPYFRADVETLIGDTRRAFEANQSNYHLEAGVRQRVGRGAATLFFNHVSRHYVDRPKAQAVDWNTLGVRAAWPLAEGERPVEMTVSLGHTTLASLVGYRWIATAEMDAEPAHAGSTALFLRGTLRAVTVDPDPLLDRGGFVDASAEGGARFTRDGRRLDLFASAERRNDVFLEVPGRRDRVLIGFRISYLR
jgi:hypothetical protein